MCTQFLATTTFHSYCNTQTHSSSATVQPHPCTSWYSVCNGQRLRSADILVTRQFFDPLSNCYPIKNVRNATYPGQSGFQAFFHYLYAGPVCTFIISVMFKGTAAARQGIPTTSSLLLILSPFPT